MPGPLLLGPATDERLAEASRYLQVLYGNSPNDLFLEVRSVPTGLIPKTLRFFRLRQLQRRGFEHAVPTHLDGRANIYVSVLPRSNGESGRNEDVDRFDRLWIDWDEPNEPPKWPVAPSVEVATSPELNPGKRQAIWLLTTPVTGQECRALNLRLAAAVGVGADTGVFDPARVFRVPAS